MGSFETDFVIPDLKSAPLKMSSVVLASQVQPANKHDANNPLAHDGTEIVPSVTRVFSANQHLYLYYEVYEPAKNAVAAAPGNGKAKGSGSGAPAVRVLSNVSFFNGEAKAYETPLVQVDSISVPNRKAAVFQLDVPLTELKPGFYTCQVNVIDDAGGRFLFPRMAMLVRPEQGVVSAPAASPSSGGKKAGS
jgi:hypothetical protein